MRGKRKRAIRAEYKLLPWDQRGWALRIDGNGTVRGNSFRAFKQSRKRVKSNGC